MNTHSSEPIADRIKLPLFFDPERMKADLKLLESEEWIAQFVPQNYSGEWSIIPLKGPRGATHPILMAYSDPSCEEFEETPFLHHCNYLKEVIDAFEANVQSVRLMKLTPGSRIKEHSDYDLDAESGMCRIHVPISTNPEVDFFLNGSKVCLKEGECWYLRLSDPHAVENNGTTDRVHIVMDIKSNDWLLNLLNSSTPQTETL